MQFNIKINQLAFHSLYPDLDIKDAAIFDFLYKVFAVFESKGERISFEGRSFYWVSYSKAIEEMPMLKISNERAMKRHFDNLVDAGLLERHPDCVKLKRSYFAFTSKIERLVFSKPQDFDYVPKSTEYPKVLCTEKYTVKGVDYVPKSTQDNNTNIHSTRERGKIPPNPPPYQNLNTDIQVVTPTLEEKKKPDIEAAAGGGRAAKPTKAKGGKWGEAFTDAKAIFDEARKEWGRGRGMGEADPIYWTPKECGQLANLLTALKNKASGTKVQYADDRAFVKGSLTIFLQTAAKVDKYYMDRFTPTSIYSNFNDLLIDIKALINGTTPTAKSATAKAAASGLVMATKENTPPHTHPHFDLLQMALAKYPNTLNYARWFTVEEMERWGAERPEFLPVLHQMWTGAYMLSKMGAALSELEGSPWRKSNSEGGLFSYLVGWLNENYY